MSCSFVYQVSYKRHKCKKWKMRCKVYWFLFWFFQLSFPIIFAALQLMDVVNLFLIYLFLFLIAKLLYNYICRSGYKGRNIKYKNEIFSATNFERWLSFSVHISLIYKHLFYKYFYDIGLLVKLQMAEMETKFSWPKIKIDDCFFLCKFLSYMNIYSINIFMVSVC